MGKSMDLSGEKHSNLWPAVSIFQPPSWSPICLHLGSKLSQNSSIVEVTTPWNLAARLSNVTALGKLNIAQKMAFFITNCAWNAIGVSEQSKYLFLCFWHHYENTV